jgi:hypothetical protein
VEVLVLLVGSVATRHMAPAAANVTGIAVCRSALFSRQGTMRSVLIARGQTIGGVDAVALRQILRRLIDSVFTPAGFAHIAGCPPHEAADLFATLERGGLIESGADPLGAPLIVGIGESSDPPVLWRTTIAGNALAKARIGKPMRRDIAERHLAEVIARAGEFNDDPDELFYVEPIELFGSLTRPEPTHVGDIDLRVMLSRRLPGDGHVRALQDRWPGTILDALTAATRAVHRRLTRGARSIDLQIDETAPRPVPDGAHPVVVYTRAGM